LSLEAVVGKDKLVVSTSYSLMHTAVDLVNKTKLDSEIKSWLAFAAQKVVEVDALMKALAGQKDEAYFAANAAAQASRKSPVALHGVSYMVQVSHDLYNMRC
ncbi:5-methyltetrahydropteroyltriglutamate--homocysteine methyltransferase 1-like, partial [Miscanthus floridulus]|uniref:5-methyltetrahydropteroyltriglutamate-- homocysteine methyltransferase 1-like n=1 Tax=Miscanthus floridulus TaxID=154761 RepID=UPI00345A74D4